jgi:NAD-dependent deacetylase
LITQNVDGLHQRAGSQNIVELHGNIQRTICFDERTVIDSWPETDDVPPRCPNCGGLLRPDVVWFGESLPQEALAVAMLAAGACDLFITVGTSALVHPAASLPLLALQNGIPTVEINPSSTPITTQITYALPGPAGEILPALVEALEN